ncbi:Capsular polysaccharide biosynthesis protein [Commensalibacter communis]|uniref:Capsular polysaccharide biosynthesis protein n=1 Tax=Commensalibacter communis TaxID=2972786 RepID=A0A9W4X732_9PROT|nr:glycosyltransferase family 61 protein [Commensalibacter communis]CAI3949362.1 Capsular polysaccharide biosynthesis protein [Commensalibacter communis]CAI3960128.1 Capsular polysaccharide biosynthesis protein [Commensalibacter communis]CAI3961481.1 Capsular polysaccharide biosynthesis protein [Commensalibacter communis]CAI3961584.1 Capsular polysaccharide biosynthesis protein [Commensalibacter communis]CAI3962064.1 Capsular polysaccharide biosynthesis protein [Commensalibacter communis]
MLNENASFLPILGNFNGPFASDGQCYDMSHSPERVLPMPITAYDAQRFQEFELGLRAYDVRRIIRNTAAVDGKESGKAIMQARTLKICTIENAYLVIAPELYGVIVQNDYQIIGPPSCFRNRIIDREGCIKNIPFRDKLDDIFVGCDAASTNYYHWLLYAISKTQFANSILPSETQLVLPSRSSLFENRQPAYSLSTYEQTLALSGLKDRVTLLDVGIYPVKKLSYCWHIPDFKPELYLLFSEVYSLFDKFDVPNMPELPKRIYISREKGHDSRVNNEEKEIIERVLQTKDIQKICLEDMDFITQVALFRQAEFVMAPHGAGLANMVFARPGTALLEFNRQFEQPYLRNCFYLITAMKQQPYCYFNLSKDQLTEDYLLQAIDRLKPNW